MLDTVMAHVPHKVREHRIDVASLPSPPVDGCPCEMVPEIIYAGALSLLFWKRDPPDQVEIVVDELP